MDRQPGLESKSLLGTSHLQPEASHKLETTAVANKLGCQLCRPNDLRGPQRLSPAGSLEGKILKILTD